MRSKINMSSDFVAWSKHTVQYIQFAWVGGFVCNFTRSDSVPVWSGAA